MTLLPDLERQLRDAARRTQPQSLGAQARRSLRPRRRMLVVALAVALLLASVAVAAVTVATRTGDPAPRATGLGVSYHGQGRVLPGQHAAIAATTPDPDGGLAWGVRSYATSRRAACWQVGRVLDGRLGVLGRDGLLGDDGLFHPLPLQVDRCASLDGAGHLFAFRLALALDNGVQDRLTCRPQGWARDPSRRDLPACPKGSARMVLYGFLGPQARTVTLADAGDASGTAKVGAGGAFVFVVKLDDPRVTPPYRLSATYADGSTHEVQDVPGQQPPGYIAPQALPSPERVRGRLRVTRRRVGKNDIYVIRYRAPVAIHAYGIDYHLIVDGPRHGEGRGCQRPLRFFGFGRQDDVRRGQPMTIRLTPGIAFRYDHGWCPGRYRATVVLQDRAHPVGTFTFTAPPR